ncbi:MAG TPA: hypothetical protein VF989_08925, partial [Polyangiaceae bacterium]
MAIAAELRLERRDPPGARHGEAPRGQETDTSEAPGDDASSASKDEVSHSRVSAAASAKFYRLARVEYAGTAEETEVERAGASDAGDHRPDRARLFAPREAPVPELLCAWPRVWRRLRRALERVDDRGPVDVERVVERLGRGQSLRHLPRLTRRRLPARVSVAVDHRVELTPLWLDHVRSQRSISATLGAPPTRVRYRLPGEGPDFFVHGHGKG